MVTAAIVIAAVWTFCGSIVALALCRVAGKPVPTPFDRQEVTQ